MLRHSLARMVLLSFLLAPWVAHADCLPWPAWERFKQNFLNTEGRITDPYWEDQRTVSEGQAYAMFFALVANDRITFDRLLTWTEDHLAGGDLTRTLPAWHWGKNADGNWGVLDSNPASDADLWLAYTLAEAGQAWSDRRYRALSALLAKRIQREESAILPGLGQTVLPGPVGFHPDEDTWRLNPSYLPIQLMRRLENLYPEYPWEDMVETSLQLLTGTAPLGFSPDWAVWRDGHGFVPDMLTQAKGSYDSIRVYLWAGMLNRQDPAAETLAHVFAPMAKLTADNRLPPEKVDVQTGKTDNPGPVGFSAAVTPLLQALGQHDAAITQLARIDSYPADELAGAYYSSSLMLFHDGWRLHRYQFSADGSLQLDWKSSSCRAGN
jgi:endoglucanase